MGATTFVGVDPNPEHLGLTRTFKAGAAIYYGAVVCYADAGTSNTVIQATTSLGMPVGVAMNSATASGEDVTVAMIGSVLTVMCSATDTSIDAGHWVTPGTVAGTIIEFDPAIGAHAAALSTGAFPIGMTLDDTTAGSGTTGATVKIVVCPLPVFVASS